MARPKKNAAQAQDALPTLDTVPGIPVEEQPYPLPEGWKWVRLGDCNCYTGEIVNPHNFPKETFELYSVPSSAVDYPEIISGIDIGSSKQAVEQGDVLLCKINPRINRVWYVTGYTNNKLLASSEWIIFRNKHISSKYMMFCMKAAYFREFMLSNVSGVGGSLMRAQPKHVRRYPIPLPPLEVQQRIVERIESLFAKLDEAREKAESALESFERRKAAILHKAFTGELTATWRGEHGISLEDWKNLRLNDVADYKKGPFGSSITKAMFVPKGDETYKVYEQGNAIKKTIYYGHYYITRNKYNELSAFSVKGGDIIISCAGTIGEIYKLPESCENGVINQALMRVRTYKNIDENFFEYYFTGVLKNNVIDQANGTAIRNIPPFKILKAMPIILPSLPEQQEIVRILDRIFAREQQAREAAENVLQRIDQMKKAILARAFRGELD